MNNAHKLAMTEIRCGKFTAQLGFLRYSDDGRVVINAAPAHLPKPHPRDKRDMPIIAIAWVGSGFMPHFQSLN